MKRLILGFLCLLVAVPVWAKDFYIVDGDSLKLSGASIRLANIDAPEYYQTCKRADKKEYDCGVVAREKLESLAKSGEVRCNKVTKDIYNRDLCECFAGEVNLNLEMVKSGWAVTYKTDKPEYVKAQTVAKKRGLGIWQGKFMKPELYRILHK